MSDLKSKVKGQGPCIDGVTWAWSVAGKQTSSKTFLCHSLQFRCFTLCVFLTVRKQFERKVVTYEPNKTRVVWKRSAERSGMPLNHCGRVSQGHIKRQIQKIFSRKKMWFQTVTVDYKELCVEAEGITQSNRVTAAQCQSQIFIRYLFHYDVCCTDKKNLFMSLNPFKVS